MLIQELSRHAIDVTDHLLEISGFRIVAKGELRLLPQVVRHIGARPHLSKDLTRKSQGPSPLVWHRHVFSPLVGYRGIDLALVGAFTFRLLVTKYQQQDFLAAEAQGWKAVEQVLP